MTTEKENTNEKSIFIGGKPFMKYVSGVSMQFNKGADAITIKARGKFISKGVDVAEVIRNKIFKDNTIKTSGISIGSEEFKNKEGKVISVSTIEIMLKKE